MTLTVNIAASIDEGFGHTVVSASTKNAQPNIGTSTSKDIEALRNEMHSRLRQVGREVDEQLDALIVKQRAMAADRERASAEVPF